MLIAKLLILYSMSIGIAAIFQIDNRRVLSRSVLWPVPLVCYLVTATYRKIKGAKV